MSEVLQDTKMQSNSIGDKIDLNPSEKQMGEYLKGVYLSSYDFNEYVDNIRRNYLKRKQKRQQTFYPAKAHQQTIHGKNYNNDITSVMESSSLMNRTQYKCKNVYLQRLQQEQKSNLPSQIKSNQLLCSLYKKLDSFQNHLASQFQKEKTQFEETKHKHTRICDIIQNKMSESQREERKKLRKELAECRRVIMQKVQRLSQIKEHFYKSGTVSNIKGGPGLPQDYIDQLIGQSEQNVCKVRNKLSEIQTKFQELNQKQVQNYQLQQDIRQLQSEIKTLLCETQRRNNIFA